VKERPRKLHNKKFYLGVERNVIRIIYYHWLYPQMAVLQTRSDIGNLNKNYAMRLENPEHSKNSAPE